MHRFLLESLLAVSYNSAELLEEHIQNVEPPADLATSLRALSPEAPSENAAEALTCGHNWGDLYRREGMSATGVDQSTESTRHRHTRVQGALSSVSSHT